MAALEAKVAELVEMLVARDARIIELQGLLEQVRRSAKRQAAPFSKGQPGDEPARPGRKKGKAHGSHGDRPAPLEPDRIFDALLPECCPHCGGGVDFERWAEQSQAELGESRPVTTRFRVGVGRCRGCRRRVQGRHPEQTSDALGAAGSQVGPRAMAWAAWLHYGLGLSFDQPTPSTTSNRETASSTVGSGGTAWPRSRWTPPARSCSCEQGQGVGSLLLAEALRKAVAAGKGAAARLVVVDAIDDRAVAFYQGMASSRSPNTPGGHIDS